MDAAATSAALAALVTDGILAGLSLDMVIVRLPGPPPDRDYRLRRC